ncbi:glycosyltransferase family 4 protein [Nibricoccus sp. IMCC34717]|uniref:glycosyltransferase family 4 protein n=1 Tax=Nibricoccus sp. IMCC34717 TaxID=3034021 RepID=UPI00384FF323
MYQPETAPSARPASSPSKRRAPVAVVALQSGNHADGGLESLTQLVENFCETDLYLITQYESEKTRRWQAAGHRVSLLPLPYLPGSKAGGGLRGLVQRLATHVRWNIAVARLVRAQGIRVVHVNDPHALWHCGFALRLLGVRILFNIRDTKQSLRRAERLKWRLAFFLSSRQIVLSREMAEFWARSVFGTHPPKSLSHISSVVAHTRSTPPLAAERAAARQRLGLPLHEKLVGYVASFSAKKAQLKFLQHAGPLLGQLGTQTRILFLGDFHPESNAYAKECQEAHAGLSLGDSVRFLGYQGAMADWYVALDLVVVATENEGLARCMIEALAQGTPVVSFAVCSAREILEAGACGTVVNRGDYNALIQAIYILLYSASEYKRLSENAVATATQLFSPKANAAAYERVYRELGAS